MSYDFLTAPMACDHRVARDPLVVGKDRRTLCSLDFPGRFIPRQVNGASTVTLYIDGVKVPQDHPLLGWDITPVSDPTSGGRWFKITFRRRQNADNWTIEVGYVTTASYCRKCSGSSLVSDYRIGQDGSWKKVRKTAKLVQRCMKLVLTSVCPFYPSMVCAIRDRIGKKGGHVFTSDDASYDITSVLGTLKTIQSVQGRYQTLDAEEMLQKVASVQAKTDPTDPRVMGIHVRIVAGSGTSSQIDLGITQSR